MSSILSAVNASSPLASLILNPDTMHVGFVVRMAYDSADIITNDAWRDRVGGVPLNCLLVASSFDPAAFSKALPIDRTVVLLRVQGPAALPLDGENFKAVVDHSIGRKAVVPQDDRDGIDPITHSYLQFSGITCRILGTFFEKQGQLEFGADAEDFRSLSHLRVYKPKPESLRSIVNFIDSRRLEKAEKDAKQMGFGSLPEPFEIGTVRYTSTTYLQSLEATDSVPVSLHPVDFLARRTATLGMTRTGKSNTVKTMVAAVALAGMRAGIRIGQVIFDVNGEYANANGQDDGSSIYDVFSDNVVRYRGLLTKGFFDIRNNFYSAPVQGLSLIQSMSAQIGSQGQDMQTLMALDLTEPEKSDVSAHTRYQKKLALYKGILAKGGFVPAAADDNVKFPVGEGVFEHIFQHSSELQNAATEKGADIGSKAKRVAFAKAEIGDPNSGLSLAKTIRFFQYLRAANKEAPIPSSSGGRWLDEQEAGLLNVLEGKSDNDANIRGARAIHSAAGNYHSPQGGRDVAGEIYTLLREGRIVIIDLSVGVESVRKIMATNIADRILRESMTLFVNGAAPPQIVVYVEEAHNLIGKDADFDTTWPRIAKEGAKFGIALMYSTQEPSSVHANILANTENWFVTHLNNDNELRTLARFYDFEDFVPSLKRAQDVGFARIKSLSAPYVVPTQIHAFSPAKLKPIYDAIPRPKWFAVAPKP